MSTALGTARSIESVRAYDRAYERLEPAARVRLDLAVAHRWAARWGWNEGVVNHFTAMVPGYDDRFYAIPYGVHWTEVTARDFITVDLDGNVIDGDGEIELTSLMIHGAMHRGLPQAEVILHTHQPHITALTCLEDQTVEMISQHMLTFPGRIAYLNSYGLATETSIGGMIIEAMGDKDILLMANHGVTICGPAVPRAFDDLYTLDRACEVQIMALATGRPLRRLRDEAVGRMAASSLAKGIEEGEYHFRALRRLIWREEPGIAD
jgi:ribulose-5-phosphate 4-epimerase/fuculose-1-phosphate aldolase